LGFREYLLVTFVQASDTGVYTGNTTGIGSGDTAQILGSNTGTGHSVILLLQSLSESTDSITSVTSGMGTFTRVNSYAYPNIAAEDETWVCLNTTGASDSITVTCPSSDAWQGFALEWSTPANGATDGGGNYQANAVTESITVSPLAVGNLVIVFQDSVNNFTDTLGSPWSIFGSGVYFNTESNGTSAAWQIVTSTASVSASWSVGGGEAVTSGAVIEYASSFIAPTPFVKSQAVATSAAW
jgi:hypothetical protein